MDSVKILLLDPATTSTAPLRDLFVHSLDDHPFQRHACPSLPRNRMHWEEITRQECDVVFFIAPDDTLRGWCDALQYRAQLRGAAPLIAVLDDPAPQDTAALLQTGVADFMTPPLRWRDIAPRIMRLVPRSRLHPSTTSTLGPSVPSPLRRLVGSSASFVAEMNKLPVIGACDTGVLIEGETGTGKEVFARAIHALSPRAQKPFVAVNCGSIPVELAESELFGHERGAFTGANLPQQGLVAQADGGTLFLDEIGSLPLLAQVKLLRFLQEKEYRPLGAARTRSCDVRVIAAANAELHQQVARGTFRQDLFYRLNIIRVGLPPLRERRDDIPALARHFLDACTARLGRLTLHLSSGAMEKLVAHTWPGNVRELEHVIERSVVFCPSAILGSDDIALGDVASDALDEPFRQAKARAINHFERHYLESLLTAHGGNISSAARRAGKNRRAFWELIRKHRIQVERFRAPGTDVSVSPFHEPIPQPGRIGRSA